MYCPFCNQSDQIIGRACTRCGRTVTHSLPANDDDTSSGLDIVSTVLAAEAIGSLFDSGSGGDFSSVSVPDSSGFSGFDGGDTGGGGAGGDF